MQQQLHEQQQSLSFQQAKIRRLTRAKDEKERQFNQQLESSEQERAKLEKQVHELEKELLRCRDRAKEPQRLEAAGNKVDKRNSIILKWREGKKAPFDNRRWCDAVIDGDIVYFLHGNYGIWTYNLSNRCWLKLPKVPCDNASLVVLNGLPTSIGGNLTNKLMSLTIGQEWIEQFPPMPTKRYYVTAVCTGIILIVAGGRGRWNELTTVEVLNTENSQWSTADDLPVALQLSSATVCGDQLYILGGGDSDFNPTTSVYTCSVSALLQTCTQRSLAGTLKRSLSFFDSSSHGTGVWSRIRDLNVIWSTCVTFCGQLLAVGGENSDMKSSTAVYLLNPSTNSWNVISYMSIPRSSPFAAVLPGSQLMVVGGQTKTDNKWTNSVCSDSVEFGYLC